MLEFNIDARKFLFNSQDIKLINEIDVVADLFPIVYILFDETAMVAYIGESTNAKHRLSTHLSHPDKKKLSSVYIIASSTFNKSAVLDIESYLIQSIPSLGFKLLNGNAGIANHNYYQKDKYHELYKKLWSELSFNSIPSKTLLEIENSDMFKFSPYKSLSQDQFLSALKVLSCIADESKEAVFVSGLAGTGKTVLAIYLIKLLFGYNRYDSDDLEGLDDYLIQLLSNIKARYPDGLKIGFVVPMSSLRNTLKTVFKGIHGLSSSIVIGPSDVAKKHYDLLIVDESHRLTRRRSITNYKAFDDTNRKLRLKSDATQLDWIMESSQHQIFFYDSEQSIKPADVREDDFQKIKSLSSSTEITLISQLRSKGGESYVNFIDKLLRTNLGDGVSIFDVSGYELKIFNSMEAMVDALRNREHEMGLARMMSGYSWEWISKNDPNTHDVVIDGVKLTWNRVSKNWINSTTDATEMGCIHTVQGYDLNYAGVIFGKEIDYDKETQKITIDKSEYFDSKGKAAIEGQHELHEYIIKIYKTMMYRGIKGTYIYACNSGLKEYFSKSITQADPTK